MNFFTYDGNNKVNGVWEWTERVDALNGKALILNGLWEGTFKDGKLIEIDTKNMNGITLNKYQISLLKHVGSDRDYNQAICLCQIELDKVVKSVSCN